MSEMPDPRQVSLDRKWFGRVSESYRHAMWNYGRDSVEHTDTCIQVLRSVIDFYRAADPQEEKRRRANYFGLSIPELEKAISRATEYRDGLIAAGGTSAHVEKVSVIYQQIRTRRDYQTLGIAGLKGHRKWGK